MHLTRQRSVWLLAAVLLVSMPASAQDVPPASALTWIEDPGAVEAALKTAEVIKLEDIGTGVTKPQKATLAAGGPVAAFVWKDVKPGIYQGYWESYKSEIAAYELDKLLELRMTPPYVERRIDGELGAAGFWVDNADTWKSMGGPPSPPSLYIGKYNWQLIRAKMFHNLIYNKDPNLGNWMVDPAWNLIIIDNSRAFTTDTDERVHVLTRVDRDLWDRFVALDEATLATALGEWLTGGEIDAILKRRGEMRSDIDAMVEDRGERTVFVRYRVPPPAPSAPPAASDETAEVDLEALAGRLVDALNENPFVLEGSELSWLGRVVRLADTRGPHEAVASDGLHAGHTYGLVHDDEGLMWLARDHTDPEPHDALGEIVGRRAEVFGITQETEGVYVVRVSLSRSIS